jgi:hypothetical protein
MRQLEIFNDKKVSSIESCSINFILILIILCPLVSFALTTPQVTVSPDETNHYAEYVVNASLTRFVRVEANEDSLIIIFNPSTVLPESINPALVTVNGVACTGVSITGQRLALESPIQLWRVLGTEEFTIVISTAAKIKNPGTSGGYTLAVQAVQENGNPIDPTGDPATSNTYNITPSTSTITTPAVAPSPTVAGQAAAYTIAFNVGSGGYLMAGSSTITIGFDPHTTIPNGSLSGVTINAVPATAVANNDTVVITIPVDVDNNGSVTVNFALGSGIINPSSGGLYTLGVKTSSENSFILSDSYSIANQGDFSVSTVSLNPEVINTISEYNLEFITSSSGALTANIDSIIIVLQPNTKLPSAISTADVLVSSGGFSDNAAAVRVLNANQLNADTLEIVTPVSAGNNATVDVTLKNTAGILNPSEAGNYNLAVRTSKDISFVNSNPYQVTRSSTTVSQVNVTPTSRASSDTTSYEVEFNLGSKGRLRPGVSTITITFPNSFTISTSSSSYDTTRISVAEGEFKIIDPSLIAPNNINKTIDITVPSNVVTVNGDNIVLILDGKTTDPIINPTMPGNYILNVKTSAEPTDVNSSSFAIGGTAVNFNWIVLSDSTVNSISQYTINFDLAFPLTRALGDYVKIIFPEGTTLPSSILRDYVEINGTRALSVSVVQSTRTVTTAIPQGLLWGTVTIDFDQQAGIINPPVPSSSFYKAIISTSQDFSPVDTRIYEIIGDNTQVTNVSASANPSVRNVNNVAYTVYFTTSATGKIVGSTAAGSSTITVDFDIVTVVPSSISATSVKVNSMVTQNAEILSSGDGGIVRFTMPEGLSIANNSVATVVFDTSAGLDSRDMAGTFNVQVRTSSDTTYSDTTGAAGNYIITNSQDLTGTQVSPNPSTQNAPAAYTVKFTTGSMGALSTTDSIRLYFPSNTSLPTVINLNDITVNGNNPSSNPRINGNTIVVPVPNAIASVTPVTVLINQSANIVNPTLVQSYTLNVGTDVEPGPFVSPSYNITQTSTTLSVADVSVTPQSLSSGAVYTVDFSVGNNGRLLAGTSSFTITFNSSTIVNSTAANYDSCYIVVDGAATQISPSNISINGQAVSLTVPVGVSVDNQDNVRLILSRNGTPKPITNPSSPGNYTLQVRSSVETSNITSNAYTISNVLPVTGVRMRLAPDIVNAASTDTISFRIQNTLTGGSGTITIIFPFNTFLPTTIANSNVRIANHLSNPTNFNNANAVSVNTLTRTVVVTVPSDINGGDSVRVAFLTAAGLENPSIYGNYYTVRVKTSSQPLEATSAAYTLQPTTTMIQNLSVNITPYEPGQIAEFQYSFRTGSRGRLVSGVSKISLIFPYDVNFTQGVPATSKVTVNSTAANALELHLGTAQNPDTLVITVPSSVTIGNNANVSVLVDETAGVQNASTTEALTYEAFTSVETVVEGMDISLPVELSAFQIENTEGFVKLKWITESEVDNAYWLIHRKELTSEEYIGVKNGELDLYQTSRPFLMVEYIEGQGTTNMRTEYSYIDSSVTAGFVYAYRLADVSFSGYITYHEVLFAEIKAPLTFELNQNYPNPFNPSTTISYSIPEESRVELKIYNILGQEILTLVDKAQKAGFYKIEWNARNKYDQRVASGIYVYTITAKAGKGAQQYTPQVRKMVLIK